MNDDQILDGIFDPDAGFAVFEQQGEIYYDKIDSSLLESVSKLEKEAVSVAETSPTLAMNLLTQCINKCPTYASAYNNRAQLNRILGNDDKSLEDLELAIKYGNCLPRVLGNAYTQRAILRKKQGQTDASERDFQMGAKYGNEVAKSIVKNNPYAKLCNVVMAEALKNL